MNNAKKTIASQATEVAKLRIMLSTLNPVISKAPSPFTAAFLSTRSLVDITSASRSPPAALKRKPLKHNISRRGLYISQSNPLRCIETLNKEHMIITCTMRAFSQFVEKIDSDLQLVHHRNNNDIGNHGMQKKEICASYMNDWNAFIVFAADYNKTHHRKEEILYGEAEKQIGDESDVNYAMIRNVNKEHYYEHKLYHLIAHRLMIGDDDGDEQRYEEEEQFVHNVDNIVSSAKLLIDLLFKHIVLENDVVYPRVSTRLLGHKQMERISQELEEIDRENSVMIQDMECLSQALVRKFNTGGRPDGV